MWRKFLEWLFGLEKYEVKKNEPLKNLKTKEEKIVVKRYT